MLSGTPTISEIAVPPPANPIGIVAGNDGNLWFTDAASGKVGTINPSNPTTGGITEYGGLPSGAFPGGITKASDGSLWFGITGGVGTINPTTKTVTTYSVPNSTSSTAWITTGPDGNIWFTENNGSNPEIGEVVLSTRAVNVYPIPITGSQPTGITAGPNNTLWFSDQAMNKIGVFSLSTHAVTEYGGLTYNSYPYGITLGPDGNLWFVEFNASKVGMMNATTKAVTEYPMSSISADPEGITVGPDNNLWFTETGTSMIGTLNPSTGTIAEYPIGGTANPFQITKGPDNNLWYTDSQSSNGNIGLVNLTGASAPPQVTLYTSKATSVTGGAVKMTAVVTIPGGGTASGKVNFLANQQSVGSVLISGTNQVTFSTSSLGANNYTLTAQYIPTGAAQNDLSQPAKLSVVAPQFDDFLGIGRSQLAVFRPSDDTWRYKDLVTNGPVTVAQAGDPSRGDIAVPGDYEGIGKTDLAYFDPNTDYWTVILSNGTKQTVQFGDPSHGDVPVPGDYYGNGEFELGLFDPKTDYWNIESFNTPSLKAAYYYGDPVHNDLPVPGDFDGNGVTDLGLFDPLTGYWNILLASGNITTGLSFTKEAIYFPKPDGAFDIPTAGDFVGVGQTELAFYNPNNGVWSILNPQTKKVVNPQFGDYTQGDLPINAPLMSLGLVPNPAKKVFVSQNTVTPAQAQPSVAIAPLIAPGSSDVSAFGSQKTKTLSWTN